MEHLSPPRYPVGNLAPSTPPPWGVSAPGSHTAGAGDPGANTEQSGDRKRPGSVSRHQAFEVCQLWVKFMGTWGPLVRGHLHRGRTSGAFGEHSAHLTPARLGTEANLQVAEGQTRESKASDWKTGVETGSLRDLVGGRQCTCPEDRMTGTGRTCHLEASWGRSERSPRACCVPGPAGQGSSPGSLTRSDCGGSGWPGVPEP